MILSVIESCSAQIKKLFRLLNSLSFSSTLASCSHCLIEVWEHMECKGEGANLLVIEFDHKFQALRVGWEGYYCLFSWAVDQVWRAECTDSRLLNLIHLPREHRSHRNALKLNWVWISLWCNLRASFWVLRLARHLFFKRLTRNPFSQEESPTPCMDQLTFVNEA